MRLAIVTFLLLSSSAFAADLNCASDGTSQSLKPVLDVAKFTQNNVCPNSKKIKHICMFVDDRTKDSDPLKGYEYKYQRQILEAACVDVAKDSEEVVAEKIRKMWSQFEGQLICNSVRFDVPNGNIIKYAISTKFDLFIDDIVRWKVNLNKVDEFDKETVLDYLQFHIKKNEGNPVGVVLKNYYQKLRKAGAKHKSEL